MSLLLCCHTMSYRGAGRNQVLQQMEQTPLRWLELPVSNASADSIRSEFPTVDWNSADCQEFRDALAAFGIGVKSCALSAGDLLDPVCYGRWEQSVRLAAELGASVVTIEAGAAADQESFSRLCEAIATLSEFAFSVGLQLCLETAPGICVDHYGMQRTMLALSGTEVGLSFDTGNLLYYNAGINGEIALAKTCQWVRHVRLRDSHGEFGETYFPALGYGGAVDFTRVLEILKPCGFRGPFSIAIEGIATEEVRSLQQQHDRVLDSLRTLSFCGYFDAC